MNQIKLKDLIMEKKIVVPLYFLRMLRDFSLDSNELIVLLYLYDKDNLIFDPGKIKDDINMDLMVVMEIISSLEEKGLINIKTIKNDKGIMEEVISLEGLFNKISLNVIECLNTKEENSLNIHNLIEEEFGRKLTSLEHEMIDDWDNNNFDKELVREAVKEASINGVSNLRYIDKILIEWSKKGYKKPSDIKKNSEVSSYKVEIFNCDWLNEDEEI